jgi:hypothetical protein
MHIFYRSVSINLHAKAVSARQDKYPISEISKQISVKFVLVNIETEPIVLL